MADIPMDLKQKINKYAEMKKLAYDNNLNTDKFFDHIRKKTELGNKFIEFFRSITEWENLSREMVEFCKIVFPEDFL